MYNRLGKLLLALIAAVLVVDPVMACCFSGSVDPVESVSESDKPPCHGSKASSVAVLEPVVLDLNCEGCDKCVTVMAAKDVVELSLLLGHAQEESLDVTPPTDLVFAQADYSTVPIIPSGFLQPALATPVALKQKLHI